MEQQQSQTPNVDKLSSQIRAQAMEAGSSARTLMDRATVHHQVAAGDATSSHSGDREAMRHTQGAPGKSQASLSPTDGQKGQTQTQQRSMGRSRGMER